MTDYHHRMTALEARVAALEARIARERAQNAVYMKNYRAKKKAERDACDTAPHRQTDGRAA